MNQLAVTAAPVVPSSFRSTSSSTPDDATTTLDATLLDAPHDDDDDDDDDDEDAAKVARCRRALEEWMGPVMVPVGCVALLVVVVVFSRPNVRGQCRRMRLACWSMTLCHGMLAFMGIGRVRTTKVK
jgi:hypothetical protein